MKQVQKINYLCSLLTEDEKCDIEIRRCVGIAKDDFQKQNKVLKWDIFVRKTQKCAELPCYMHATLRQWTLQAWTESTEMFVFTIKVLSKLLNESQTLLKCYANSLQSKMLRQITSFKCYANSLQLKMLRHFTSVKNVTPNIFN